MANKMVSNIKSLTTGVGDLVKTVDKLYASLNKVNTAATKALTSASSTVSTVGGQYGLTQGANRPGTGADAAHFPTASGGVGPKQNIMSASLASFSAMGGYPGYGQYGPSRFPYPGMPPMPPMGGGMSTRAFGAMGAVQFGLGIASGAYQMMPGLQPTMDRTLGYYQAGLRAPGINRNQLERATFGAMGGGLSGVGSDAQVAAILAGMGYAPGSQNYLGAAGQIGGAYKYLGMSNEAAAAAIGGFQTGPMQANLFQYGITTFDMGTGKEKTTGQIAKELMNYMTGGRNVTVKQVQESYKMGALGANLQTMGFSADQQNMLYQAMIDLASGRNPDLQNAAPVKGNENTFLTSQGRLNASTTDVMMSAEEKMIKGFENAADTVEFFNRQVKHAADALGYIIGYSQGVSGTPAGKGAGKIGKTILGGVMMAAGAVMSATGVGASAGVPLMVAGGMTMAGSGSTSGYGASFGVSGRRRTGGSSPGAGAPVTAGYGATNNSADSPWAGTNGSHTGVDYAMPIGTAVTSVYDGTVSAVNLNADYGTSVMIDNINGTQAVYAHLSEKSVKVGDTVKQGQRIGKSGKSGNAQEPHLHFELRDAKNHPVDPSSILSGVGSATSLFGDYATVRPTVGNLTTGSSSTGTSGTPTLTGAMGSKEQQAWAKDFLTRIGAPASDTNVTALNTWMNAEGKGFSTSLNRGTFNPLNTTLDMPGAVSFNSVGVKAYNSYEDGMNATIATLTGKNADARGYTAILNAFKADAGTSAVLNSINNSAWRTGKTDGSGAYKSFNVSGGGATSGYGAAIPSATVSSGNRTVNVNLKIERASEEEAVQFAKRVKYYLEHDNETSMIGRA